MKHILLHALLLIVALLSFSSASAQAPLYAKNSGLWDDYENWTTDASGLVFSNREHLIPGVGAQAGCDVTISANRSLTITLPAVAPDPCTDAIVINELTVNGEITIIRPASNTTQKITIRKLYGTGKFRVNTTDVLHFDYTTPGALTNNVFDMSLFQGTVVLNNDFGTPQPFGNPLVAIDHSFAEMPMPSSTLEQGIIVLGTDYIINGDLTINPGCTLMIAPNINVTVKGNVINKGTLASTPSATKVPASPAARLRVEGNFDNTDGRVCFFSNPGGNFNSTIVEFCGSEDSELILNDHNPSPATVDASPNTDNLFFRIVCNKDDRATAFIYAHTGENCLTLGADKDLNTGVTYREMPMVVRKGNLKVGHGVYFGSNAAKSWWNAVAPADNEFPGILKFDNISDSKGSIYIPLDASITIAGGDIRMGDNNPLYVAGSFIVESGEFYSSKAGVFYVFPIDEDLDANHIDTETLAPSRLTVNGGECHLSRNVVLDTSGKPRQTIHYQNGGILSYDIEALKWDAPNGYTNKTVYLGAGSQFVMNGGTLDVKTNAIGNKASKTIADMKLQILMANMTTGVPQPLATLIAGGDINIRKGESTSSNPITVMINGLNDASVEAGAYVDVFPVPGGVTVNGDFTVNGYLKANSDFLFGGNFTVSNTGTFNAPDHNVKFIGKANTQYKAGASVTWKDVILEKEQGGTVTIPDGSFINIAGDMTANSGKMVGRVIMNGSQSQNIYNYCEDNQGFSGVNLEVNTTSSPSLATDVVLNNVKFTKASVFDLGYYNLKLNTYPTSTIAWGTTVGFRVPTENTASAHGLTLPIPSSVNDNNKFPMIVKGLYTYVIPSYYTGSKDAQGKTIGDGYITVIPIAAKHPATAQDAALKNYWIIKCTKEVNLPSGFSLYKCLNFIQSDNLGGIFTTKRQIFFTAKGSYRGAEISNSTVNANTVIQYKSINTDASLSAEFTGGNSSNANDNYIYATTRSGNWSTNNVWGRRKVGDNILEGGNGGNVKNATSSDEVHILHDVVLDAGINNTTYNIGVITIAEGATLTIKASKMSNLRPLAIKGSGTLIYDFTNQSAGLVTVLQHSGGKTDHTQFCTTQGSRLIFKISTERRLELSTLNEFYNLEILSENGATFSFDSDQRDLRVRGNLIVNGAKVTWRNNKNFNYFVNGNLEVQNNGFLTLHDNAQKEFMVRGDVINNGTIRGGGCPVYLWNSVTNNGTIDIAGDVYFWGPSGVNPAVTVATTATPTKTNIGSAIHIYKSSSNCEVQFNTPVTTGNGSSTTVELVTGVLNLNAAGAITTLRQYTADGSGSDFKIPAGSSLYLSKGTANVAIKPSVRVNSLSLSGKLSVSGSATFNIKNDDLTDFRGLSYTSGSTFNLDNSTFNTAFITPTSEGSSLDFTASSSAVVNCSSTAGMVGYYGVFDLRGGKVDMAATARVNISSLPLEPKVVPALYFAPSTSTVGNGMAININAPSDNLENPFLIDALSPLGSITVASSYVKLVKDKLAVNGAFTVNNGCVFDANVNDVDFYGNVTLTGSYNVSDGQTTSFVGSSAQTASGNLILFNMVSDASQLNISQNVNVTNKLLVNKGSVVISSGKVLRTYRDATIKQDASVTGDGTLTIGKGSLSDYVSIFFCEGNINNLNIDNVKGVDCYLQQAGSINISNRLTLTNGVFDIAGNMIELVGDATIAGSGFGINKMISTNGSFTDNGVKMYWEAQGKVKTFIIPLGKKGKCYTPVILNNVKSSNVGNMCFSTNDEIHPELATAIEKPANTDKSALPFYWVVACDKLQGASDVEGSITFQYPNTSASYANFVSANYLTAANNWVIGTTKLENTDPLTTTYSTKNRKNFSGEYTACSQSMVVDPLGLYIAVRPGNWEDPIWLKSKLTQAASGEYTISGEFETDEAGNRIFCNIPENAGAIIQSHVTMTGNNHNAKYVFIAKTGTLEIADGTKNNNLTSVQGVGVLKLHSSESIPAGRFLDFCKVDGGTIEYSGTKDYNVFDMPVANNVIFSGTGKRILRDDVDVKVFGTVTVDGPELVFRNNRSLNVESHLFSTFDNKDAYDAGAVSAVQPISVNLVSGSITGDGYFSFDAAVYSKRYNTAAAGQQAVYVSPAGETSVLHEVRVGITDIPGVILNNGKGVHVDGDFSVKNITFNNGVLRLDHHSLVVNQTGKITGGSENSFIEGKLKITPQVGIEIKLPLGDYCTTNKKDVYAETGLIVASPGQWEIEYLHANPKTAVKDYTYSGMLNEYWSVKAPNSNAEAMLRLRWNGNSHSGFPNKSVLLSYIDGRYANGSSLEWERLNYTNYSGVDGEGTLRTIQHKVGHNRFNESDNTNYTRYYAMSVVNLETDFIWIGRVNTNWNNADNWLNREVPGSNGNVTIRNVTNSPEITTAAFMNNLNLERGATLIFSNKAVVVVNGSIRNNAKVYLKSGVVDVNLGIDNENSLFLQGGHLNLYGPLMNEGKIEVSNCIVENYSDISNNGSFDLKSGTTMSVSGNLNNSNAMSISGASTTFTAEGGTITNNGTFNVTYAYNSNPTFYYTSDWVGNKPKVNRTFQTGHMYYTGSATEERIVDAGKLAAGDYVYHINASNGASVLDSKVAQPSNYRLLGSVDDGNIMNSAAVMYFNTAAATKTIVQTGTLSKAVDHSVDLAPSSIGWVWLTQPFPFTVDVKSIQYDHENGFETIYTRVGASVGQAGGFETYNTSTKVSTPKAFTSIAPFQSFCVGTRYTNQGDPHLTVTVSPDYVLPTNLKDEEVDNEFDVLRVQARAGGYTDEMAFVFREGGHTFYTSHDSDKRTNDGSAPSISTLKSGKKCVIAFYPALYEYDFDEEIAFPIAIDGNKNDLTIVLSNIEGFDNTKDVFLRNNVTGEMINARQSPLYVVDDAEEIGYGDLEIVLKEAEMMSTPTDMQNAEASSSIMISAVDNTVIVDLKDVRPESYVNVYDIMGQLVARKDINDSRTTLSVAYDGLYIVEVIDGDEKACKKVILKK